jgi:hypothetical protein
MSPDSSHRTTKLWILSSRTNSMRQHALLLVTFMHSNVSHSVRIVANRNKTNESPTQNDSISQYDTTQLPLSESSSTVITCEREFDSRRSSVVLIKTHFIVLYSVVNHRLIGCISIAIAMSHVTNMRSSTWHLTQQTRIYAMIDAKFRQGF